MEARRRERGPWVPKPGTWALRHLPSSPVLRSWAAQVRSRAPFAQESSFTSSCY